MARAGKGRTKVGSGRGMADRRELIRPRPLPQTEKIS